MATVSADGQTFLVNNRRIWIVGGVAGYAGVPRSLWRKRLERVREMGLNAVSVPVVWSEHEPTPGKFSFQDSKDVAAFCQLAGELGLWVIVQAGPVVAGQWSLGGMPAHLLQRLGADQRLRTADSEFMAAVSSYFGELTAEIAPLQVTRSGDNDPDPRLAGRPIVAVQVEHHWRCGHDELASEYLNGLTRYLREGGVTVPLLNVNSMYAQGEGAIETWSGYANLHAVTRQLRRALPDEPAIIGELLATTPRVWGEKPEGAKTPGAVQRAMAEALSAGGQFVLGNVAPGLPRGFAPGRFVHAPDAWASSAPPREFVAEDGSEGPTYAMARRLCTFASSFGKLFGAVEVDHAGVTLSPSATAAAVIDERTGARASGKPASPGVGVEHLGGAGGSVAFVFGDDQAKAAKPPVVLSLPSGLELRVELGKLPCAWVLIDTHLHSNQRLDYSAFCTFTLAGRTLVLFGPAGASGMVSINGSAVELTAPRGKTPVVEQVEGTTVVLCNEPQIDATRVREGRVYVGAAEVVDGEPVAAAGFKTVTVIDENGAASARNPGVVKATSPKVKLGEWAMAGADAFVSGESDRYAKINGPASLESLGTPTGYAWLRLRFKSKAAKRQTKVGLFHLADRALVSLDGGAPVLAGLGPGAEGHVVALSLKKSDHTVVLLLDNLGRFVDGMDMRAPKGLFGHVSAVEPIKCAPTVETATPFNVLEYAAPLDHVHAGDTTHPDRLTWSFKHLRKSPVVLHIAELHWQGVVLLNGEAVAPIMPGRPISVEFTNEQLKRGVNEVQIAVIGGDEAVEEAFARLKKLVSLYEATEVLTEQAEFAFAGWEPPKPGEFEGMSKSAMSGAAGKARKGLPTWWRCSFDAPDAETPLQLNAAGLSKGQLFVNGHNVSRYCMQTPSGAAIPPQGEYYIPRDILFFDEPNELLLFDEHGCTPHRVTIKAGPLNG